MGGGGGKLECGSWSLLDLVFSFCFVLKVGLGWVYWVWGSS